MPFESWHTYPSIFALGHKHKQRLLELQFAHEDHAPASPERSGGATS